MTRGVAAGWYPDYEAGERTVRYWDGARWTERRREPERLPERSAGPSAPAGPRVKERSDVRSLGSGGTWGLGIVGALVVAAAAIVLLGPAGGSTSAGPILPPPASTPGPPTSTSPARVGEAAADPTAAGATTVPGRRTWVVRTVVDANTVELTNGAQVRLVGIAHPTGATCATQAVFHLADLVTGQTVTLTRRGRDKDTEGHLLRYVEVDGRDIGLGLIRAGLATATPEPHARGGIYRNAMARIPAAC